MELDHRSLQVNILRAHRLLKTILIILIGLSVGACPGPDRQTPQQVVAQLVQEGYLKASNTGVADRFGYKVAISGNTLAVGAILEGSSATGVNGNQIDNSAPLSGAVYVFTREAGGWLQQAYLKASNTEGSDHFGSSIALSGDTLVVGAVAEDSISTGVNGGQADNSASGSGAVYVFTRVNGAWAQQTYLKASNTEADDAFGWGVAISEDTIAVGAVYEDSAAVGVNGNEADNTAIDSGAVYVFARVGGVWSQQAYLKASNANTGGRFGYAVAMSGDTLVVGAQGESSAAAGVNGNQSDSSAPNSGAVYVFTRNSGIWSQQAYLKASNADAGDAFGGALGISGDTLVVGAVAEASSADGVNSNQADNTAHNSGAAYVFTRVGNTWAQQAYLKASNSSGADVFGSSVAIDGNWLAVGALGEASITPGINGNQFDDTAVYIGAVYTFTRTGVAWSQQAYVKASDTGIDMFGSSLSLSGNTLVVGAPLEASAAVGINGNQADNSAPQSGAAYVFQRR